MTNETAPIPRTLLVCPHCHSKDITREAQTRWDANNQKWRVGKLEDVHECADCGETFSEPVEQVLWPRVFTVSATETIEYQYDVTAYDAEEAEAKVLKRIKDQGHDNPHMVGVLERDISVLEDEK